MRSTPQPRRSAEFHGWVQAAASSRSYPGRFWPGGPCRRWPGGKEETDKNKSGKTTWSGAAVYLAEDGTGQQLVLQELGGQGVNVDSVEEGVQVRSSALHVPADPVCAGFVHLRRISGDA